jgi:mannose/cellobiose epimerase-like protein (N-acyl-D-glucosamine 2-epimerase family)
VVSFSFIRSFTLFLLASFLLSAQPEALPPASRWIGHNRDELMKYWSLPEALGDPVGNFPTTRCNDGRLYDPKANPCPEIKNNASLASTYADQSVVALSRAIYGYGVAFHLTGNPQYLHWMKAGVDWFRAHYIDRRNGGAFTSWIAQNKAYGPAVEARDPQQLGYSLLGIGFYYYLTRDADVVPDIEFVHQQIIGSYWNPAIGTIQWFLKDQGSTPATSKRLVAVLDQMNAYMVLLAPILPEPLSSNWKRELIGLSNIMIEQFWSEKDSLYFLAANTAADKDLTKTTVDFGHSIKALWMTRWAGLLNDDPFLVSFAEERARRVLDRAWRSECRCWANGVGPQGIVLDHDWWVFAELDQYSASLSLRDPYFADRLPGAYQYWLTYITDPVYGEVWPTVDGLTNSPKSTYPKAWTWKSAYHSFEHSLVAYITTAQLQGEPATLYFAFKDQPPAAGLIRPYFFTGQIVGWDFTPSDEFGGIQTVQFADVR